MVPFQQILNQISKLELLKEICSTAIANRRLFLAYVLVIVCQNYSLFNIFLIVSDRITNLHWKG